MLVRTSATTFCSLICGAARVEADAIRTRRSLEEAMARARAGLRWAPGIPGSLSRTIAGQRNSSAEQWDDPVTEW